MTDKQIIIDGVDVSGCENYGETMAKTHNCTLYDEYLRPCKGTDCYYKQLKRKEQELNDYKKQFKADTKEMEDYQNEIVRHLESIEYWVQQFKAKEQECEELKKQLTLLDDEDVVVEITVKQFEEYKKLKQTLTEIKEIAEDFYLDGEKVKDRYLAQDILQKISEVEND